VLGEHMHRNLVGNKLIEWDGYRTHVSEYEIKNYLPIL
jgi:glutamine synthetase